MAVTDDLYIRILADGSQLGTGLNRAQGQLDVFGRSISGLGGMIAGAFSVAAIEQFISHAMSAADESARAMAKVSQAIKSTGGVAGQSLEGLKAAADDFKKSTLFDDDAVLNDVSAQLLTFTNIAGDNFPRAQQAALDLATVLGDGEGLRGISIQLGKALNDPVQGLTALKRSGISFSAEQVSVIKNLSETNHLAEAQAMILGELEHQYGGQAQAAANASNGLVQFGHDMDDVMKMIGGAINKSDMFKDALQDISGMAYAWSNSNVSFWDAIDVTIFGGSHALMTAQQALEKSIAEYAKIPITGLLQVAGPLDMGIAPKKKDTTYGELKAELKGYQDDLETATQREMSQINQKIERKKAEIKAWEESGKAVENYKGSIKGLQVELDLLNTKRDTATGDANIAAINQQITKKEEEIKILKNATEAWVNYGAGVTNSMAAMAGAKFTKLDLPKTHLETTTGKGSDAEQRQNEMDDAKKDLIDMKALNESINSSISGGLTSVITSMTEAAATGGNVGAAMLGTFGGILSQLGQMLVKEGMGILAAKIALRSLDPYKAIAAGVGLIAIGSMFSQGAKSLADGSGSGGGSGGGSYGSSGTGSNVYDIRQSQAALPSTITLKVEGRDLVASVNANTLYYARKA